MCATVLPSPTTQSDSLRTLDYTNNNITSCKGQFHLSDSRLHFIAPLNSRFFKTRCVNRVPCNENITLDGVTLFVGFLIEILYVQFQIENHLDKSSSSHLLPDVSVMSRICVGAPCSIVSPRKCPAICLRVQE